MNHLVLFDFDGTLADTAPDLAAAANRQRDYRGLAPLPYEALRPHASHGARGMLKAALDLDPEDAGYEAVRQQFIRDYEAAMTVHTALFPGISDLLSQIAQAGFVWGVVTNKAEGLARPIMDHLGLADQCRVVIGGDTTAYRKPHPGPLLTAARQAQAEPQHCVYIGDDVRDILAGKAAGMTTIAAAYGYCSLEDPASWQPDAIAAQPAALWPLIDTWAARD